MNDHYLSIISAYAICYYNGKRFGLKSRPLLLSVSTNRKKGLPSIYLVGNNYSLEYFLQEVTTPLEIILIVVLSREIIQETVFCLNFEVIELSSIKIVNNHFVSLPKLCFGSTLKLQS